MQTNRVILRWAPLGLLLVCLVAAMPGVAFADHHDRDEHHHHKHHRSNTSVYFRLGFSNAPRGYYAPAPRYYVPAPRCGEETYYYDPYCRQRFASLEVYIGHLHHHRHPAVIRVMDADDDEPIYAYRHRDDGWVRCDD